MEAQTIIAKRIAQELRSGMLINLGIGIPTLVANYVPQGVSVPRQFARVPPTLEKSMA